MRQVPILLLSLVAIAAFSHTRAAAVDGTGVDMNTDKFLQLIKSIERSSFFPNMTFSQRVLTFEFITAAETDHLAELLRRTGYIEIFEYIDALPLEFQHQFISFSIDHLNKEIKNPDQYDVVAN